MFKFLGTPAEHKKHVLYDGGHASEARSQHTPMSSLGSIDISAPCNDCIPQQAQSGPAAIDRMK